MLLTSNALQGIRAGFEIHKQVALVAAGELTRISQASAVLIESPFQIIAHPDIQNRTRWITQDIYEIAH
ncbi:hypothetical protein GCM10027348_16850 [Hymenobacter tenuis]